MDAARGGSLVRDDPQVDDPAHALPVQGVKRRKQRSPETKSQWIP